MRIGAERGDAAGGAAVGGVREQAAPPRAEGAGAAEAHAVRRKKAGASGEEK